jgi:hypothetical protein
MRALILLITILILIFLVGILPRHPLIGENEEEKKEDNTEN